MRVWQCLPGHKKRVVYVHPPAARRPLPAARRRKKAEGVEVEGVEEAGSAGKAGVDPRLGSELAPRHKPRVYARKAVR